jgi:hypothetical protein
MRTFSLYRVTRPRMWMYPWYTQQRRPMCEHHPWTGCVKERNRNTRSMIKLLALEAGRWSRLS